MITATLIANVIAFGCLFSVWSKDGFLNLFLKMMLFGMVAVNFYLLVK